ncbi:MAG: DUF11 domain-containing protein [Thermodesulfobacteriota bacterium]|nr:DUF11 domain-containing protein [Thermodesulfobacteriota bacterium]
MSSTSAILNGTVNPNGVETTVGFEWGTDTSYGSAITATQSPVSGTSDQSVSAEAPELIPGTTYHFRVKATNSEGSAYGVDELFNTPGADISVQKSVSNLRPDVGEDVVFTITVSNNGPDDATGVQVTDQLPAGLAYVGDDSEGYYAPATGIWDVGDLANGYFDVLHITARVDQAGRFTNTATRTASSPQDPTPGNDSDDAVVNAGGKAMPWLLLLLFGD